MPFRIVFAAAVGAALLSGFPASASAESRPALTLSQALQRAMAANPRLAVAGREIGAAKGKRQQAGALPNPELSFDLDNALGSGDYRGLRSAETTLQLSQLVELGGKRAARIAAGSAEVDSARWQRAALRLEILSETASAFYTALSAQRRTQIYDAQIASLQRLTPLLQRRIDAGASSPAEISRTQVAADLVRAERERTRTALAIARRELATLMGSLSPDFPPVAGDLNRVGRPPAFATLLQAVERNPQLIRWTAVRAQRDAELLAARLKPIPDLRLAAGWRHYRDTGDNAVRLGVSIPLPVWDQNLGNIQEARENLAKTEAERAASKAALILVLGRAYDTLAGALREIEILRSSAIPNARQAITAIEDGYSQGRFSLLEVLEAQATGLQAALREQEALLSFHTSVATIEGLTGSPMVMAAARSK